LPAKASDCEATKTVYLQYGYIHADLVFRSSDLSPEFRAKFELADDPEFVVFGIGDRDIYIHTPEWADLKVRYALKALFLPSSRAIHIEPAFQESSAWASVEICEERLRALEDYVADSFSAAEDGSFKLIEGLSYTGRDVFYEADGIYTLFNSCNNWANGAMKTAGVKTSIWSPFSFGIVHHAKRHKPPS